MKRKITRKTGIIIFLVVMLVGLGSGALINYISNSITATVDVTGVSLGLGLIPGISNTDPTTLGGWDLGPSISLPGINVGEDSGVHVMVSNPTTSDLTADVNLVLSYTDPISGPLDPFNCINGVYNISGTESCRVCGPGNNELCMDGQELDVIGVRIWNEALGKYDPELDNPFGLGGCVQQGAPNAGDFNDAVYNDGTYCYWNFADELRASGAVPNNPVTIVQLSNQDIPPGALYAQVLVKYKMDGISGLQAVPGTYSLTANIQ